MPKAPPSIVALGESYESAIAPAVFTVLRFTKLKSLSVIEGAGSHNTRLRETQNADPEALRQPKSKPGTRLDADR
jgi:hypothetical protein